MKLRPVDENGDILPVLSSADMLSGPDAVAGLVKNRLELYCGDWWENPDWGNEMVDMLKESRLTEADTQTVSSYLTGYVQETSGVREVRSVHCSVDGKQIQFSCAIDTDDGQRNITMNYEF